jgi:hypothetical protein
MCPQKVTTGSAGTSMQIAHVKVEGLLLLPPPLSLLEVVCGDDCVDEDDIVSLFRRTPNRIRISDNSICKNSLIFY